MRFASIRALALGCLLALGTYAQQPLTVAKVVEFVRSSVQQKLPDKEVAGYLAGVRLTDRLDSKTVESLQGQGAGARTVAALIKLAEASAKLTPPAPKAAVSAPAQAQRKLPLPPFAEQQKVLAAVREYAMNYSKSLPDFICLQVTRRYEDPHYRPGEEGFWALGDRLVERLSYFDQQEKYEPLSQNDTSLVGRTRANLGGMQSRGEFGTLLNEVFGPESEAEFQWERWGMLRGHLSHVFSYRVDEEHSRATVSYAALMEIRPGYHGEVFVDKATNQVLRVTRDPEPPPDFPMQNIHQVLDYSSVDISGKQFFLPLFSQVVMRTDGVGNKNEIEFRSYRKYAADITIQFDAGDEEPVPEDQKNEQTPK